ncbi:MAG: glycine cleavage system protein GcvH [Verrucomicrobiota bacterium]|nr:glycine cleavage system protein GcvH [Verrucomicrobiota bacterium]MDP6250353.1 glycine cleavage system protein GcvH [Verrucomicrobiota bacterium]MDP7291977.1 glycine cleavage system protein GcvH [Verrucomicrobiota bacterium]MDP7440727.1 glycine cleavage system protein GcvH [Verrucomicrobiota bacterium]|tara:strand:- start:1435 stop:1818 length:384 start_codon:yes stop_codon:yes gene_type:complete
MSDIPTDLNYASSHEWVSVEGDTAIIGISDHAQEELTELVFIELPEIGLKLTAGDPCAVVESVKTASDIYAPVSGQVIETNDALDTEPGTVNEDPYGDGWFFKVRLTDSSELGDLLSPEDYAMQIDM